MRFPYFLIIAFFTIVVSSQKSEDVLTLHKQFKKHIFKNADTSLYYIHQLKNLNRHSNDSLASYYYHQDLGQYHFVRGQMDSSEYHYKKAHAIGTKGKWDTLAIDSKIWLANHQYFKGNMAAMKNIYEEILKESKKANYLEGITTTYAMYAGQENDLRDKMNLYLKIDSLYRVNQKESSLLARVYISTANLYTQVNWNRDELRDYINKSMAISKRVDYPPGIYEANRLLVKSAMQEQEYDKAIAIYKEIYAQGVKYDDPTAKDVSNLGLAKVYFTQGTLDKARAQLNLGSYLLELPKGAPLLGQSHLLLSELWIAEGNKEKALFHLNKARLNPDPTNQKGYEIELLKVETKFYDMVQDFEKAYKTKIQFDDQIAARSQQQNSDRFVLEEQLKLKKKNEQELALLKSKNELEIQKQKSQRNLLLGGIGLTSLAGLFLFILYRNRQRTNKKLRDIDTLKTNFFTNISHEFRTPLTVIKAPISDALENPDLSSEKRKHFELAKKNSEKLETLVDQLLELSKIDSGNRGLMLEKNYPTQLIAAWSESFSYLAEQKNISYKTTIHNKEQGAWFDRDALENIVVNLLGNAVKYTPEQGIIELISTVENDVLKIQVKNSGKGLTKNQTRHLFNRFYQTDGQNEGTGIGLSLIKELVELHGGHITVSSKMEEWTLFEVVIKLDKDSFKNAKIKEIKEPLSQPGRRSIASPMRQNPEGEENKEFPIALLVEDNPDVGVLLTDTFKQEYRAVLTKNGQEGIEKALELIPDIIISDIMMPIKDGIQLTKTLKKNEKTSHIPIVLLTAKAGDKNELIGIETGADDYITKPFNKKILMSKVNSLITQRNRLRARYSQEVILKPKDIAVTSVDTQFLEKVQKILDEKLVESSFSTEQFSKATHMSRMQLHRKLKALTGLSASEFIRSQRLKLAAQILKSSDINISEVGYSVGFNNHAYFSKCFKEAYNCTPSEFSEAK